MPHTGPIDNERNTTHHSSASDWTTRSGVAVSPIDALLVTDWSQPDTFTRTLTLRPARRNKQLAVDVTERSLLPTPGLPLRSLSHTEDCATHIYPIDC
ncbi:hypothetical protein AAHC03_016967 [Spirometra sp. Aus1]